MHKNIGHYSSFLNQSPGHDPVFPSTYCVTFQHSAYCFLWLIFLLAFPAARVWVSRLPVFKTTLHVSLPSSHLPPSPAPPSSSIHHSTAHFTVSFCLLPPSVSLAPLACSFMSPSSHPLPVQPPDMNSFYPLTVFPSSSLHFPSHHSSSGPLSISLPPLPPLCQAPVLFLLFLRLAVERLQSCWQCFLCEPSAELHSPLASHCSPHRFSSLSSTSLPQLLLHPTYIPLQAGELTFQPWAAGLNDCL